MKSKSFVSFIAAVAVMFSLACSKKDNGGGALDDFDPRSPEAQKELADLEKENPGSVEILSTSGDSGCYRDECPLFVLVDKKAQKLQLYVNGQLEQEWLVSTGGPGHGTPNFDKRPDGRIYNRYSSTKYPGGNYNGLGNMPYAMFIQGGFAIHGTTTGNFKRLGTPASHGCIRLHPDNAKILNELLRATGVANTWITVQ